MASRYDNCKHLQRKPAEIVVTKEIVEKIGTNYRVMPMFEEALNKYKYMDYYSLKKNELLRCRWLEYNKDSTILLKKAEPLIFPSSNDDHFFNGKCRMMPELSISRQTAFRFKMSPGPGVDHNGGQKPIPQEFLMKRGGDKKHSNNSKTRSTRNTKAAQNKNSIESND